jgi:hypothetical protein
MARSALVMGSIERVSESNGNGVSVVIVLDKLSSVTVINGSGFLASNHNDN